MGKRLELSNKKFGRLTPLEPLGPDSFGSMRWQCKCFCGALSIVTAQNLTTGHTRSCGCLAHERKKSGDNHRTHGFGRSKDAVKRRFYGVFRGIVSRCNPNTKKSGDLKHYVQRGIRCGWKTFEEFRDDMFDSYLRHEQEHGTGETQIDRVDNNAHYSKENCRWATRKEQQNNKGNNHIVIVEGTSMTLTEASELVGLKYATIHKRLKYGWSVEDALNRPLSNRKRQIKSSK